MMNWDKDFVRSLAEFLALHTEQSAAHLQTLIASFMRGLHPGLDPAAKAEIGSLLKADIKDHQDVPSFLQNYLHGCLTQDKWSPQGIYVASMYRQRRSGARFVGWKERQQLMTGLEGELIRGTELGFRHMLYSQGAGAVFRWRGLPCFKSVYDLAIYAMLVDELRPGTIIELGSGSGASALFFADLPMSRGPPPQIISIDTAAVEVSDPRISFVRSDCVAWLKATAQAKPGFRHPVLVIEDFHGDLAGFFQHIDAILEAGDYLVIEDSTRKQERIAAVMANRPYLVDTKYTDFFGFNCTSAINSVFVKSAAEPREDNFASRIVPGVKGRGGKASVAPPVPPNY